MGRIKSALEIALERTETVKTDKASIGLYEAKQQGKRLANAFLADPSQKLEEKIKKYPGEQQKSVKQGIFDVLHPQIALPAVAEDLQRMEIVGKGLSVLITNGRYAAMFKEFLQVLTHYFGEAAHYEQAIRQQYAPKLRQKEEELSRRLGREVRLDPFQDPEFAAYYNQNLNALKANYQTAVDQMKNETISMWDEQTGNHS